MVELIVAGNIALARQRDAFTERCSHCTHVWVRDGYGQMCTHPNADKSVTGRFIICRVHAIKFLILGQDCFDFEEGQNG